MENKQIQICEYCGNVITKQSHKKNGAKRFCSVDCYYKASGKTARGNKIVRCQYCLKEFTEKRDAPNLYCSKACATKGNAIVKMNKKISEDSHKKEILDEYRRTMEKAQELIKRYEKEKQCDACGRWFVPRGNAKYCSKKCAKKIDNIRHDKRLSKNGKPDLTITLTRLYMRDQGVCQICGKTIDFDCDSNSDDYPSIDHIIPISKGGQHQWDNVQLACRKCNTLKRDKIE